MIRYERLLKQTYALTFKSEHRIPVAAVISKGSNIVSCGCNNLKSHPLQKNQYIKNEKSNSHAPSVHAELIAINNFKFSFDKRHILYVCRRKKNGSLGLAKPCSVCMDIIRNSGLKKIVYSIDGFINKPHYGIITV